MDEITLTSEQRETLREYAKEVFSLFTEERGIKENIKDIVSVAAEKTGLEKAFIKKLFTVQYKAKLAEMEKEIEMLKFLIE